MNALKRALAALQEALDAISPVDRGPSLLIERIDAAYAEAERRVKEADAPKPTVAPPPPPSRDERIARAKERVLGAAMTWHLFPSGPGWPSTLDKLATALTELFEAEKPEPPKLLTAADREHEFRLSPMSLQQLIVRDRADIFSKIMQLPTVDGPKRREDPLGLRYVHWCDLERLLTGQP